MLHTTQMMIFHLAHTLRASQMPLINALRVGNISYSLLHNKYQHWALFPDEFVQAMISLLAEAEDYERCEQIKVQYQQAKVISGTLTSLENPYRDGVYLLPYMTISSCPDFPHVVLNVILYEADADEIEFLREKAMAA